MSLHQNSFWCRYKYYNNTILYNIHISCSEIVIVKYNIIIIRLSISPAALCRHYRFNVIILWFFVIKKIKNSMYLYHIFDGLLQRRVRNLCLFVRVSCVCCAGARESGKSSTFLSLVDRLVSVMHTSYKLVTTVLHVVVIIICVINTRPGYLRKRVKKKTNHIIICRRFAAVGCYERCIYIYRTLCVCVST